VTVTAAKDNSSIVVSVKDTGIGIKKEDIPKLFQDFSQLGEGRSRKGGSTGLGLAISKKIIQAQKGEIWVESEPGKGSDFKFKFPIKTKFKVLAVDDDKNLLDICRRSLEKEGYDVASSESGLKALEMIEKDKPDMLLLDMKLLDINGYEIIGRLRSSKATFMIPILVMSGYPEELAKLEDGREDSALLSIAKPFRLEEMMAMIRGMLKQGA
jgi:CheY-like chemotaxis protein